MNAWTRRALVVPLLLLLTVVVGVAAAVWWLLQRYDNALGQLEPRLERLAGVVAAAPDIQANLDKATEHIGPWLHPAGTNVQTDVQQRLRQLIDGAGLTTVALQAAQPDGDGPLARVRLTATLTGPWPSMVRWLQTLQGHNPAFWVQSLSLQREGRDLPTEPQTVRLTLQIDAPVQKGAAP